MSSTHYNPLSNSCFQRISVLTLACTDVAWTQEDTNTVCKCVVDNRKDDRTRRYKRQKQGAYFKKRTMKIEKELDR